MSGHGRVNVMNPSGLFDIIHSRRSVRRYQDRPVARTVLRNLLEAANWAPSAHNRQPWRFVVIVDPARKESLARVMGGRFSSDLAANGVAPEQIKRQLDRSYRRICHAPAVIVLCLSMINMDKYPDENRRTAERVIAIQSVALAAQNLLLAAHAEGLGVCWMCAPLFCPDVVRTELSLPDDWEAQALFTLGYPDEVRTSLREPIETKTIWY